MFDRATCTLMRHEQRGRVDWAAPESLRNLFDEICTAPLEKDSDHRRIALGEARALGLQWDMTLGSGWSSGGPAIDEEAERQLLLATITLTGPMSFNDLLPQPQPPSWVVLTNTLLPAIDDFDEAYSLVAVVAMEVLDDEVTPPLLGPGLDLTSSVNGNNLVWEVPDGTYNVFAIYENRTSHFPLGAAYPGAREDARIIDHLDRSGIDTILEQQGAPWLEGAADCPPRAVFVDSFELVGELPWTTTFASTFEDSYGYAIEPFLPFLFRDGGESEYVKLLLGLGPPRYQTTDGLGIRAREDYESFRAMLFLQEFIERLLQWTHDNGVQLRLQAHGGYGDVLDAYGAVDVPESEGLYAGGSYDFLKLAASAAHITSYGTRVSR